MSGRIIVGTCGFCLSHKRYFATFPAIEIQQTFYQPPSEEIVSRWRNEAPAEFEFTLKAFQAITHPPNSPTWRRSRTPPAQRQGAGFFQDSPTVRQGWQTTKRIAGILQASTVIFQCPPRFDAREEHIQQLRWFFSWADRENLRFGLEVRHSSWTAPLLRTLCRELELTHVVDPFAWETVTPAPRYFRLHGIGGYDYRYNEAELRHLYRLCRGKLTYCMFNNSAMLENALEFQEMVRSG